MDCKTVATDFFLSPTGDVPGSVVLKWATDEKLQNSDPRFFSAPCTSTDSQRLFSAASHVKRNVSGYVCNHGSLRVGNETLRPLGVAMGNAVSVTRVWSIHTKTPPVGRQQPMTSLLAWPQYKGEPGKYVIHFFVWSLRPKHGTAPRGRSVSFPTLREPWLHT